MTEENKSTEGKATAAKTAPIKESNQADASPAAPATQQQLTTAEQHIEERMSAFERSMIRLTTAGVIVAGITLFIFLGQLYEMYEAGAQTDKLLSAANALADAAGKQASAAGDMANAAHGQVNAAKDFSNTAKDINQGIVAAVGQLQVAANNTRTTIRDAQTAFRDEQRAWVGMRGTDNIKGFTETEPWKVTVVFFNSGRTPARNTQSSVNFITSPVPIPGPSPEQVNQLVFKPAQSIAPQGTYLQNIGMDSPAEIARLSQRTGQQTLISQYMFIKNKQLFLYYFGILKYDDVSGGHRETRFCIYLADPNTKEVGMCDGFNDLN